MQSEKGENIIFIDLDTVIRNPGGRKPESEIEKLRTLYEKDRIRKWAEEQDAFRSLTDEEVLELDSWDREWAEAIQPLLFRYRERVSIICMTGLPFELSHLEKMAWFGFTGRPEFRRYYSDNCFVQAVRDEVRARGGGKCRYLVLSRHDYSPYFHCNFFLVKEKGQTDFHWVESKADRIFSGGEWDFFSLSHSRTDSVSDPDYRDKFHPFYKVIFLDIDGVLNDEGKKYIAGAVIDREMVACLKRIVADTDADIILTSSWKQAYRKFVKEGYRDNFGHLEMLDNAFSEAELTIAGITPLTDVSGPSARPYEIRLWLERFHDIYSYVILEDDTFWEWGFLQRNVITTQTYRPEEDEFNQWERGLTMEMAEKAVHILNDEGAMIRKI